MDGSTSNYTARHNKYIEKSDAGLHDLDWWRLSYLHEISFRPNDHARLYLMNITKGPAPLGTITELVCGRADEFDCEWVWTLEASDAGVVNHVWQPLFDTLIEQDEATVSKWVGFGVLLVLEHATDYFMRVLLPCRPCPRLLLWLIHKPGNIKCTNRMNCAKDLISLAPEDIGGVTTLKLIVIFRSELVEAAQTGLLLCSVLYELIVDIAELWGPDTQYLDGDKQHH